MKLILGSNSKRRQEILSFFSLNFFVDVPLYDESQIVFKGDPKNYVSQLAMGKNLSLKNKYPQDVILTADTTVFKEGKIYNKPKNLDEAFFFLKELSGCWHQVFTGVCVQRNEEFFCDTETTHVLFHPLTELQIQKYLSHLPILDKAAAYAIQGSGNLAIAKIEGCFYNVMGLPLTLTARLLEKARISLWDHLK